MWCYLQMLIPGIITHAVVRQNFPGFQGLQLEPRGNWPGRGWNSNSRIWTSIPCSSPITATAILCLSMQSIRKQLWAAKSSQTCFALLFVHPEPCVLWGTCCQHSDLCLLAMHFSRREGGKGKSSHKEFIWAFHILLVLLWNTLYSGSPRGEINNYLWGKKFTWLKALYPESNSLLAVSGIWGDEHQLQPGFWVRAESRGNHSCSRAPVLVISFRMIMAGLFFYHSPPLLGGGFLYHQIPSKSSNTVIQ